MANLISRLKDSYEKFPEEVLIDDCGRQISWSVFLAQANGIAQKLATFELDKGSKILLSVESYFECYASIIGTWMAGHAPVLMNPKLSKEQQNFCVEKTKPSLLLYEGASLVEFGASLNVANIPSEAPTLFNENLNPPLYIFTSGSTGMPKSVELDMNRVAENAYLTSQVISPGRSSRLFINTPPYFTSGFIHFLTQIFAGGSVIARKGFFFGKALLDELESTGATGFGGAPAHFAKIFEDDEIESLPSSLKFFVSSGDHLSSALIERAHQVSPQLKFFTIYGLTEVSGRLCILPPQWLPRKTGAVGFPLPGMSITICGEDGEPVPQGELGEVIVKGPLLMNGYFADSQITQNALTKYGFRTGDYGFFDEEKCLWLRGRRDGVFKSGAEKVSTLLIQDALTRVEAFKDFAVLPRPDAILGTVPVVFYVLRDGSNFERTKVVRELKAHLPPSHIPRAWIPIDQIPRTESGKIRLEKMKQIEESL